MENRTTVTVDICEGIATITLDSPQHLNALSPQDYDAFSNALRDIDSREDVIATVWQGPSICVCYDACSDRHIATGNWFCAGTNVKASITTTSAITMPIEPTLRDNFLRLVASANTDCNHALYTHRKVLVAALNGPVMGIAAAFLGNFDFIYALPDAWLYLGFPFLGVAVEGGASVTFVNRMGLATANEVLLFNKKKTAQELLACGFINKIFPAQPTASFHTAVREHLRSELDGLLPSAVLSIKTLIKAGLAEKNDPDAVNLRESYAQATRFASGVPTTRFRMVAQREIRHKL